MKMIHVRRRVKKYHPLRVNLYVKFAWFFVGTRNCGCIQRPDKLVFYAQNKIYIEANKEDYIKKQIKRADKRLDRNQRKILGNRSMVMVSPGRNAPGQFFL